MPRREGGENPRVLDPFNTSTISAAAAYADARYVAETTKKIVANPRAYRYFVIGQPPVAPRNHEEHKVNSSSETTSPKNEAFLPLLAPKPKHSRSMIYNSSPPSSPNSNVDPLPQIPGSSPTSKLRIS